MRISRGRCHDAKNRCCSGNLESIAWRKGYRSLFKSSLYIIDCFTNLHTPLGNKVTFIQHNYVFTSLGLYNTPTRSLWVPAALRPPLQQRTWGKNSAIFVEESKGREVEAMWRADNVMMYRKDCSLLPGNTQELVPYLPDFDLYLSRGGESLESREQHLCE